MQSFIENAISQCPFLHAVREAHGDDAARNLAARPFAGSKPQLRGPILQEYDTYDAAFASFHGPGGTVPLNLSGSRDGGRYPFGRITKAEPETQTNEASDSGVASATSAAAPYLEHDTMPRCLRSAPFATISLSTGFLGDGWPWAKGKARRQRKREDPKEHSKPKDASQSHAMRQVLQPLTALVVSKSGHLVCPPPIVWMRATIAKTPMCRALRPMDIEFKLAACGMLSALVNLPPGMVKEHLEKFSPGWFVAIHISIPFVAALRKAVVMPKYALVVTIAGAIAGQMIGGRIERLRLKHREEQAQALALGQRLPDEVPLYCALMKAVVNPWDGVA